MGALLAGLVYYGGSCPQTNQNVMVQRWYLGKCYEKTMVLCSLKSAGH